MDGVADELLISAASQMSGAGRRMFLAAVCLKLCEGNTRKAEYRFGWGRETIAKGLEEQELHPEELAGRKSGNAGKKRSEDQNPQLAIDIRLIVEPHTQTDPELKTDRRYTNLSATEVRQALLDRGYSEVREWGMGSGLVFGIQAESRFDLCCCFLPGYRFFITLLRSTNQI